MFLPPFRKEGPSAVSAEAFLTSIVISSPLTGEDEGEGECEDGGEIIMVSPHSNSLPQGERELSTSDMQLSKLILVGTKAP